MVWSEKIQNLFKWAELNGGKTDESVYYGPYNSLLNFLFPLEENFSVCPQYRVPTYNDIIDFGVIFIVQLNATPVFFLEVKKTNALEDISTRMQADKQMRKRVLELRDKINVPILHGISAIGTRLAFYLYSKETDTIEPKPSAQEDPYQIKDLAPANWWQFDVMEPEGEERLLQVVQNVKNMCRNYLK